MNKIKKWPQMVSMNRYYNRSKVNALSNKCIVTNLLTLISNNSKFLVESEKMKFFTLLTGGVNFFKDLFDLSTKARLSYHTILS